MRLAKFRHLEIWFGTMPEGTEVLAQISEPMLEFQVAGIQLASQPRLRFWSLNSSEYFKISDTYVNMETDEVFVHFLIFRVPNMSYNNNKIDSTSKIAESQGHEQQVILSFVVQGSEHSLYDQQEIEGLVYHIFYCFKFDH